MPTTLPVSRRKSNPSSDSTLERPLPSNLDAERSILGAILLDNCALKTAIENVRPEDFFLDQHRRVYVQMIALGESQQAIDLITLTEELQRRGELEASGGAPYLSALADGMPRVSNVEHYARIVKEKALLRNLIHATHNIQDRAFAADSASQLLATAASEIAVLNDTSTSRGLFHSVEDFESAPPLNFGIDQILQNDAGTIITGLPGVSKTWIQLSIAKAKLRGAGTKLWSHFTIHGPATRCVYLCPESSLGPFGHRLRLMGLLEYVRNDLLLVRTLSAGTRPNLNDPGILKAAEGSYVFLDTLARFHDGADENSASEFQSLAADIFRLLSVGARAVCVAHHAPKSFAKESATTLESAVRGSGDIAAIFATGWAVRQIDARKNVVRLTNIKARDFEPCQPFQLLGRPSIDEVGDFMLDAAPGECDEESDVNRGGAPGESRGERSRRIGSVRKWLAIEPYLSLNELKQRFANCGILLSRSAVQNYKREAEL